MVTSDFSMGEKTIVRKANRHAIFTLLKSNQGNRQQCPLHKLEVRVGTPLGLWIGILGSSCHVIEDHQ